MKSFLAFFLILLNVSFATINEPFTFDLGTGYREDRLRIRLHLPGNPSSTVYQEDYDHIRFVQSEVTLRTVQRDVYLYANGGYGAIGTGDLKQSKLPLSVSPESPSFRFDNSGFAGHILGILGYMANLTPGRYYQVSITPLFGYAYYYEKLRRKDPSPDPFLASSNAPPPAEVTVTSSLSKDLVTEWRGFFIGGQIDSKPITNATFTAFYAYHFLGLNQTLTSDFRIQSFSTPGVLSSDREESFSANINPGGNHGHLGILSARYMFTKNVGLMALGKIWYFFTGFRDVKNRKTTTTFFPTPSVTTIDEERKYKLRHTSFYIMLFLDVAL